MCNKSCLQYGLYSCFVGGFLYSIFGTIKEVSIGPSSLMALVTLQYTRDMPIEFVVLLCFLAGCVELLMGVLNLGWYRDIIHNRPNFNDFFTLTIHFIIYLTSTSIFPYRIHSGFYIDAGHVGFYLGDVDDYNYRPVAGPFRIKIQVGQYRR